MPTSFGSLPVGARFAFVLCGVECQGFKVLPFPLLNLQRNGFHSVNAILKPYNPSLYPEYECMAVLDEEVVVFWTEALRAAS